MLDLRNKITLNSLFQWLILTIFYDFFAPKWSSTRNRSFFYDSGSAQIFWFRFRNTGAESVILNEAAPAMLLELGTYYLIKITLHYQIRNFNHFFFKFSKKFVFNPIQIRVIWNFMKSPIQILIRQKNHSLLSSNKKNQIKKFFAHFQFNLWKICSSFFAFQ